MRRQTCKLTPSMVVKSTVNSSFLNIGMRPTTVRSPLSCLLQTFKQSSQFSLRDGAPIADIVAHTKPDRIHFDPIHELRVPQSLCAGPAALLGDAAHAMTANLGQGACLAIEDAWVLASVLAREGLNPAALGEYSARRRSRAVSVQRISRMMGWVIQRPKGLLVNIRNAMVRLTPRSAGRLFFKRLTGFVPDGVS
jgi:2-polyprenyl-6-methoxyphenol hydroxylase-like FAD-dependent oxidoreductase